MNALLIVRSKHIRKICFADNVLMNVLLALARKEPNAHHAIQIFFCFIKPAHLSATQQSVIEIKSIGNAK